MDQHPDAGEREVDVFPCRLVLGELNSARDGAAVQPAIGVDSQGLTGEVAKVGGLMNGLEQWQQAWNMSVYDQGQSIRVSCLECPLWWP